VSAFPPVGIEVALALLEDPECGRSVTDLAGIIGRAAGGVSERLRALRDAGLVDRRNRPILPDLFWELVGPWHQRPAALASFPGVDGPFDQLSWLGLPAEWVLTDTQAALLLGAPVIASSDGPPSTSPPRLPSSTWPSRPSVRLGDRRRRRSDLPGTPGFMRPRRSSALPPAFEWPIPSSSPSTWPMTGPEGARSSRPGTRHGWESPVSGEPVLLVAEVHSVPYRAVARLGEVAASLPGFALIGRLAVNIRLGQAHRATNDVDAVSDDQDGLLGVLSPTASIAEATVSSWQMTSSSTSSMGATATRTTCPTRRIGAPGSAGARRAASSPPAACRRGRVSVCTAMAGCRVSRAGPAASAQLLSRSSTGLIAQAQDLGST
jgi:hypothetical protein